jgi:membrane-associated phospholipid phosphatase
VSRHLIVRPHATALVLAVALVPAGVHAQDTKGAGLEYRASLDAPLTLAGVAGTLGPRLLTDETKAWSCKWCDRDGHGRDTLNGLDAAARRHWRWSDREKAHSWSNVTLGLSLVAPTAAFAAGREGFGDGFGGEMLIVLEAAALNMAVTQGTKYLFRRERPWAHFDDPPLEGQHKGSRESVVSFVSGHSSLAFALAVSTGSLASLRADPGREWVWATGLTCAAATAYLRVAADKHYLTDVLAGAVIGTAVGWAVPRLFDRRPEDIAEAVAVRPPPPVAVFSVVLAAGSGPRPGGVLVTGGLQGGGPFVSATWGF